MKDYFDSMRGDVQRHEDNLKFLKLQAGQLDESILDLQENLAKFHSTNALSKAANGNGDKQSEKEVTEQILKKDKTAAGILCWVKNHHAIQASKLSLIKDVVGIVATLGSADNDNLSKLLSEYLGLETMLAIVCQTLEGVEALVRYEGCKIDISAGLHGLASSIGRSIDGRFLVICLEDLSPYVGSFVADDPQRKLALLKPKLPNGRCPAGFLDFAVNMIHLNDVNLLSPTGSGHSLRETLFYTLFSRLHGYRTRSEMLVALPCITHGAVSLDGGMIRKNSGFVLGKRNEVDVNFPVISGKSDFPPNYFQIEDRIRRLKLERLSIDHDMQREKMLLEKTKPNW